MKVGRIGDDWHLGLSEARVEQIQIDYRLGLLVVDAEGSARLVIETRCVLTSEDLSKHVIVPEDSSSLAPILQFFNAMVKEVGIRRNGRLVLSFASGALLEVDPDSEFEAWQLGGPGFLFVCSPGGEVAEFFLDVQNP